MANDVLLNKAATIERCVARAREEYAASTDFATDYHRQDAAILNIQRACQAVLDMGQHLVYAEKLGLPQDARGVFDLLQQAGWIDKALSNEMKKMVGFRNLAVHEYQEITVPIVVGIIQRGLDDCLKFSAAVLKGKIA